MGGRLRGRALSAIGDLGPRPALPGSGGLTVTGVLSPPTPHFLLLPPLPGPPPLCNRSFDFVARPLREWGLWRNGGAPCAVKALPERPGAAVTASVPSVTVKPPLYSDFPRLYIYKVDCGVRK